MQIRNLLTSENFAKAIHDPSKALNAFGIKSGIIAKVTKTRYGLPPGEGIDVMSEEWDNLILLDATRYDIFTEECGINGELRKVVSRGGNSAEFLKYNFNSDHHDTVYITANPHYTDLSNGRFHAIETTIPNDYDPVDPADKKLVWSPETVTEVAAKAKQKYPNKRLIIHYMQPHKPYIGETAEDIRQRLIGTQHEIEGFSDEYSRWVGIPWTAVTEGPISEQQYVNAYRENLQIALSYARILLDAWMDELLSVQTMVNYCSIKFLIFQRGHTDLGFVFPNSEKSRGC